jgi:hypothetical protein
MGMETTSKIKISQENLMRQKGAQGKISGRKVEGK